MKKIMSLRTAVCLLALLVGIGLFSPLSANAQTLEPNISRPIPLYRFQVPGASYGFLLTTNYQEGVNLGYTFVGQVVGGVVPPSQPGWTPAPGQGLVPMYRWRVRHRAGTNYYYSASISPDILANSENTLDGFIGYGLLPSTIWMGGNRAALHLWYSSTNGYWYASNGTFNIPTPRPNSSYNYQGVAYVLPIVSTFIQPSLGCDPKENCFTFVPPPTAPTCDANQEQACYTNGGNWNSSNCSCSYVQPPDDEPMPCRPGMICPQSPYNPQ